MNKNFNLETSLEILKDNFNTHNNYIKKGTESNNYNEEIFKIGTQKNNELIEKMNEMSAKGGISSGAMARSKIVRKSKSHVDGSLSHITAVELSSDGETNKNYDKYYNGVNRGKEIIEAIKESLKNK